MSNKIYDYNSTRKYSYLQSDDSDNISDSTTNIYNYENEYKTKYDELTEQYNKLQNEYSEAKEYLRKKYFKNSQSLNVPLKKTITQVLNFESKRYKELNQKYTDLQNLKPRNEKESETLVNNYSLLTEKYKRLIEKNHNNYVLIGKMKKIIIAKGNLQNEEQKLGGISMVELAFQRKEEEIESLTQANQELKLKIDELQIKPNINSKSDDDGSVASKNDLILNHLGEMNIKQKFIEKGFIEKVEASKPIGEIVDCVLYKFDEQISALTHRIEALHTANNKKEETIQELNKRIEKFESTKQLNDSKHEELMARLSEIQSKQQEKTIEAIQKAFQEQNKKFIDEIADLKRSQSREKELENENEDLKKQISELKNKFAADMNIEDENRESLLHRHIHLIEEVNKSTIHRIRAMQQKEIDTISQDE